MVLDPGARENIGNEIGNKIVLILSLVNYNITLLFDIGNVLRIHYIITLLFYRLPL